MMLVQVLVLVQVRQTTPALAQERRTMLVPEREQRMRLVVLVLAQRTTQVLVLAPARRTRLAQVRERRMKQVPPLVKRMILPLARASR